MDADLSAVLGIEQLTMERDALEEKYRLLLHNCSWVDRMDMLDQLEEVTAMDARQPGRALQVSACLKGCYTSMYRCTFNISSWLVM